MEADLGGREEIAGVDQLVAIRYSRARTGLYWPGEFVMLGVFLRLGIQHELRAVPGQVFG